MARARGTGRHRAIRARRTNGRGSPPAARAAAANRDREAARAISEERLLLARYRLYRRIGEGATSTVWLGHDENLDRQVAIKVLHAHLLADDAARQRLEREARTAARLNHPNVVAVYDVLVTDDLAAAVLEYVPGDGLDYRIRRTGPLPADVAARIGAELAAGLAAAHAEGILHRDVKPANVLLGEDGRARLADFGIAQALDESGATLTEAGNVVGTLRYMAPERLEGKDPTPASDVWGLGA